MMTKEDQKYLALRSKQRGQRVTDGGAYATRREAEVEQQAEIDRLNAVIRTMQEAENGIGGGTASELLRLRKIEKAAKEWLSERTDKRGLQWIVGHSEQREVYMVSEILAGCGPKGEVK